MRKIISTLSIRNRTFSYNIIIYANMYEALIDNKKVLYITKSSTCYVENQFNYLFNIKVKCIRKSEKSMKVILIKTNKL